MRSAAGRVLALLALLVTAPPAEARTKRCADTAGFAAAMAAVEAVVPCAAADRHDPYVRKARKALGSRLTGRCKRQFVERYIEQSTCGRPDKVVCCAAGRTKQRAPSAVVRTKACRTTCPSAPRSVGAGCAADGACVTTTTTTTTIGTTPTTTSTTTTTMCGNGIVEPGEQCDPPGTLPCPSTPDASIVCTDRCTRDVGNCPLFSLEFTSGAATGPCGETRDGAGGSRELLCGYLYIGGGESESGAGPTPDGATNRFDAVCTDTTCVLKPIAARPGMNTADPDCTDRGCNFGTPLPLPNPAIPPLGTCVLNTIAAPARGEIDRTGGAAVLDISLTSTVFVTGEALCPRCSQAGSPANPGAGTCDGGARAGLPCTSTSSTALTRDCPPSGTPIGSIGVDLSPLRAAEATRSTPDGGFCDGQGSGNAAMALGCFAQRECRSITVRGTAAGSLQVGIPVDVTLASVFCIPATGFGPIDGSVDLPGPGALSLPGRLLLTETLASRMASTAPSTTIATPTTSSTTTTIEPAWNSAAPPRARAAGGSP